MSGGINKVILVGRLGADPDLRYTPTGASVCELRIATSESWTDKAGQRQERTEWHRVVVWGKSAESCNQYLAKGRQVYVEGRLRTRSWDDSDGNKRYMTEVIAKHVEFIGGRGGDQQQDRRADPPKPPSGDVYDSGVPDDVIPF